MRNKANKAKRYFHFGNRNFSKIKEKQYFLIRKEKFIKRKIFYQRPSNGKFLRNSN